MNSFWGKYINFCRTPIFLGTCAGIAAIIAKLRIPIFVGDLIDSGVIAKDSGYILFRLVTIFLYGLVGTLLWLLCKILFQMAGYRTGKQIRWDLYRSMQVNSVAEVEQVGWETMGQRMAEDTDCIESFIQNNIPQIEYLFFSMMGGVMTVLRIHKGMGMFFFLAVFLFALFTVGMLCAKQEEKRMRWRNLCGMLAAFCFPFFLFGSLVWADKRELTVGQISAFFFYLYPFRKTAPFIYVLRQQYEECRAAFERINTAMNLPARIKEGQIPFSTHSEINTPQILFEHVSFQREEEKDLILDHFNLEVSAGECVGILAGEEEGKAIAYLIPRFYEPSSGRVMIDGLSAAEYTFADLRSQIGMVRKQDRMRYGTFYDNLLAGNPDASVEDLEKAIEAVGMMEILRQLPRGLQTPVWKMEERQTEQRLFCIVRMLLKEPAILILNQVWEGCTDAEILEKINGIRKAYPYLTILLIGSKEEELAGADRIVRTEEEEVR